jgi:phage shock protein B
MEDVFLPVVICGMLFIGLPWILFHYVTQWKKASSLSVEDEKLLDELHDTARRLDERMRSIERILAADNPNWRPDGDR